MTDLDDHVEAWHTAPADHPISKLELHEFLGMTLPQYGEWMRSGRLPEGYRPPPLPSEWTTWTPWTPWKES